ncbi:MAG: hypothetical protein LM564_01010 [Desulfurococcaceae archaeon]|nr:hypothetical protein [Desulfurococcaceae archaeon]
MSELGRSTVLNPSPSSRDPPAPPRGPGGAGLLEVLEYVEEHTRSPAIGEQLLAVLRRIASGECVTRADVGNGSLK